MARLIDATRIEQFILNNCSDNEEINTIYGELINAPTIDIVRCGECKWWKPVIYSNGEGGRVCVQTPIEPATKPDDFCSYGERRADE